MLTLVGAAVLLLLLSVSSGIAVPLSSFYSYGSAAGDSVLPPNDDGSSPAITLPAPFRFYGANYSTIFVSLSCMTNYHLYPTFGDSTVCRAVICNSAI